MARVQRLTIILTALLASIILCSLAIANETAEAIETKAVPMGIENGIWTWSDDAGSRHAIFISRQDGEIWDDAEEISTNDGINVAPAAIGNGGKDVLVVWSSFTGQQSQLHYRLYQDDRWKEEIIYYSGLDSNTAPAVALDGDGRLWLVWAGYNGVSDEIFYSIWQGDGFAEALPITASGIPDILPILGVDPTTGYPWIRWQRYSNEGYHLYQANWTGDAWSEAELVTVNDEALDNDQAIALMLGLLAEELGEKGGDTEAEFFIEIPDFITTPGTAAVHIPGYAVQSLPLRTLGVTD
jgi:hypothetical protein